MVYFIIYKPYGMLSQFSAEAGKQTLASLDFIFPKDAYPVGRLDADSEGLLLLTNDKKINHLLLDPVHKHNRTYLVQVEGLITDEACKKISGGTEITVSGKKTLTQKCTAKIAGEQLNLPQRNPPIRFRKSIPDSWMEIVLHEGKNRQVRKMTAAAGFPTLRLIRTKIEDLSLDEMKPGDVREMKKEEAYLKLKIEN